MTSLKTHPELHLLDSLPLHRGRPVYRSIAGDPERSYYIFVPDDADETSNVIVLVHGISNNAIEHIVRFAEQAKRHNAILVAPVFCKQLYGQYQQVVGRKRSVRADLALFDILSSVTSETGAATDKIWLFGFSGGAQFAHRFAFVHPERLASCVCVAAGWYTFPDSASKYPYGLDRHPLAGSNFDPKRIRNVPIHVLVGSRDTLRDESLRASPALDATQGMHRLDRAKKWFAAMQAWGIHPSSSLTVISNAGHSFTNATGRRKLADLVFQRFFNL